MSRWISPRRLWAGLTFRLTACDAQKGFGCRRHASSPCLCHCLGGPLPFAVLALLTYSWSLARCSNALLFKKIAALLSIRLVLMILDTLRVSVETILANAQSYTNVISKVSTERLLDRVAIRSATEASGGVDEGLVPAPLTPASLPLPPEAAFRGYIHHWTPYETEVSCNCAAAACNRCCTCCI